MLLRATTPLDTEVHLKVGSVFVQSSLSTGCISSPSVGLMSCFMLTVSVEVSGVDVIHKEVKRRTARMREHHSAVGGSYTATQLHTDCIGPEVAE